MRSVCWVWFSLLPAVATATSCDSSGRAVCSRLSASSVVFLGDRIGHAERATRKGVVLLDRFRVIQAFHGVPRGVTEFWVRLSDSVGTPGERYLIEADTYGRTFEPKTPELTDVLFPAVCGSTGHAEVPDAKRDIAYLQAWAHSVRKAGVAGGVFENARTRYGRGWPVSDAVVTLTGAGGTRQARTTSEGIFAFFNLSPGNYRIQARREGLQAEKEYDEITVPQRGCAYVENVLKSRTEVQLKTVFQSGTPAPNIALRIDHPNLRRAYEVKTDAGGLLDLIELNTGTFSVALASGRQLGTLEVRSGGSPTSATFVVDRLR
jgi:hypothetical protein